MNAASASQGGAHQTLARSTNTVTDEALVDVLRHALTPATARLIACLLAAS